MDSAIVRVKLECSNCKSEIIISEVDMVFFPEDAIALIGECLLCGRSFLTYFTIDEWIDLKTEFMIAYYKPMELVKGIETDARSYWFTEHRRKMRPFLKEQEKKKKKWCAEQRKLENYLVFSD